MALQQEEKKAVPEMPVPAEPAKVTAPSANLDPVTRTAQLMMPREENGTQDVGKEAELRRAAIEYHKKNMELLFRIVDRGSKESGTDPMSVAWRKACSYLRAGHLLALSPTHNPIEVARSLGDSNLQAYFGLRNPVGEHLLSSETQQPSYYVDKQNPDPGILLIDPQKMASFIIQNPKIGAVVVVDPTKHGEQIVEAALKEQVKATLEQQVAPPPDASPQPTAGPATDKPGVTG